MTLLQKQYIAFPSYHALSKLISDAFLQYENHLSSVIKKQLDIKKITTLHTLLKKDKDSQQIPISLFKSVNQSTKPKAIQASVATFNKIKILFNVTNPTLAALSLHEESIKYYATWVQKAKLSQLGQLSNQYNTCLHLMCFLQHQIIIRQDYFIDIFLKCVQQTMRSAQKKLSILENHSRNDCRLAVQKITKNNIQKDELINTIQIITASAIMDDTQKMRTIEKLLNGYHQSINEEEKTQLQQYETLLTNFANNTMLYKHLESASVTLHNRVTAILKTIMFNKNSSDPVLYQAVKQFVALERKCNKQLSTDFLSTDEKKSLYDEHHQFNASLYRTLLFIHVADAIKSGKLNLKYSYRYKAIQDYLIPDKLWQKNKKLLLEKAELEDFVDIDFVLAKYKDKLSHLYHHVNRRHQEGLNPYLKFNDKGKAIIKTPALEKKETEYIADLLSQHQFVPILQVLKNIEPMTQLSHCFVHHSHKSVKRRPNMETISAGIIGLGCNIGIAKMGQMAAGVNPHTLHNTVNWYFSLNNLQKANHKIVQLVHELALSEIFLNDINQLHSSSDGRKVNVKVDSLIASLSFKYFGKEKGVSVYTFIDERQALFHSLVMSAAEREAAYVYDGLLENDVTQYHIHSTDTHGYREGIFAAAPFMRMSYAPRIKNIGEQKIYAFSAKKTYQKKGYLLLPSGQINQSLIKENWDNILRFMATIRLKVATASQLFKRLSSYTKHYPLYKVLKEFGRIMKSIFILTYYDDMPLRQRIEKQLNRVELSNKFANAVFFANSGEFSQAEQKDQAIATACKVLIQNAVVLWNYLYLSQLLSNCKDQQERLAMVNLIAQGSMITWRHINLHGEYDFRRRAANENLFDMSKILSLSF